MEPFNKNSTCPKCGCVRIGTKWVRSERGSDRIRRTCFGCGYVWSQAPLDVRLDARPRGKWRSDANATAQRNAARVARARRASGLPRRHRRSGHAHGRCGPQRPAPRLWSLVRLARGQGKRCGHRGLYASKGLPVRKDRHVVEYVCDHCNKGVVVYDERLCPVGRIPPSIPEGWSSRPGQGSWHAAHLCSAECLRGYMGTTDGAEQQ